MVARSAQQGSEIGGRGRRALRRAFAVSVLLHAAGVAALAFLHWEEAAPVVPPVTIPVVVLGPGEAGLAGAADAGDGGGAAASDVRPAASGPASPPNPPTAPAPVAASPLPAAPTVEVSAMTTAEPEPPRFLPPRPTAKPEPPPRAVAEAVAGATPPPVERARPNSAPMALAPPARRAEPGPPSAPIALMPRPQASQARDSGPVGAPLVLAPTARAPDAGAQIAALPGAAEAPGADSSAGQAGGQGRGGEGDGRGAVGGGPSDHPGDDYLARLRQHLRQFQYYPDSARDRKEEGTVLVRFSFARDGTVLSAEIERSSGSAELDAAALQMVWKASPVPPLPPSYRADRGRVTVPATYELTFFGRMF